MKKLKYFLLFLITYLCILGFYLSVNAGIRDATLGLQSRRYIPCALAITVALSLWLSSGHPRRILFSHAFTALAWVITYPLAFFYGTGGNITEIDNHMDIAFGCYCFAFTVILHFLLLHFASAKARVISLGISLLQFILLLLPIGEWFYFSQYKSAVSQAAYLAVLQTNQTEAKEFFLENLGYFGLFAVLLLYILIFVVLCKINKEHSVNTMSSSSQKTLLVLCAICVWLFSYLFKIVPEVGVIENYIFAREYFSSVQKFNTMHASSVSALDFSCKALPTPSSIVLVIGESASKDYLSAYCPQIENRDTSPWLRNMLKDDGSILFPYAYACWGQTVPVLERALTEKNQYNEQDFNSAITIIDMAKKAGFTTYWFSNQGMISDADTPITMVAKTCDYSYWVEDLVRKGDLPNDYDMSLIPLLRKVDSTKNNFIVLHLHGTHESYIARYPKEFTKWGTPGKTHLIDNHANTILYTDTVLQAAFDYARKNLALQAFVYFSDHGGVPDWKRHPDKTNFKHLRIPLYVYLSPAYRSQFPSIYSSLNGNKNKYFTNDLTYELMCGLLQVNSSHYQEENSLASSKYKWSKDTLTTMLGKKKLSEDIYNQ